VVFSGVSHTNQIRQDMLLPHLERQIHPGRCDGQISRQAQMKVKSRTFSCTILTFKEPCVVFLGVALAVACIANFTPRSTFKNWYAVRLLDPRLWLWHATWTARGCQTMARPRGKLRMWWLANSLSLFCRPAPACMDPQLHTLHTLD
jgi:hypothetical protein